MPTYFFANTDDSYIEVYGAKEFDTLAEAITYAKGLADDGDEEIEILTHQYTVQPVGAYTDADTDWIEAYDNREEAIARDLLAAHKERVQ